MKAIYNEGRVVGLSAYEVFVKQFLQDYPDEVPPTEREWLSASLADGSSMIVKLKAGYVSETDVQLPNNTKITGANVILGSLFIGDVSSVTSNVNTAEWATAVTACGPTAIKEPTSAPKRAKSRASDAWTTDEIQAADAYAHIVDGVFVQPGTWSGNTMTEPDITEPGYVRFKTTQNLTHDVCIIMTGFTNTTVLKGEAGLEITEPSPHPENGDFLGPEMFPWASKIILTFPTAIATSLLTHIKSGSQSLTVTIDDSTYDVTLLVNDATVVGEGLDIVEATDGGISIQHDTPTQQNPKHKYTIGTRFEPGPGVKIENGSATNSKKFSANLIAGDGIEIVDGVGTPTPKKISAKISSGAGINIDTVDGAYKISATAAGVGYSSIYQDEDYEVIPYNQFCSYKNAVETWDHNNLYLGVSVLEGKNIERYYKIPAGTAQPFRWYNDAYNYGDGSTNPYFHEYNRYYYVKSGDTYIKNTERNWNTAVANGLYLGCPGSVGIRVSGITNDPKLYTRIPNSSGNYIRGYQNMASVTNEPNGWAKYGTTYYWTWDASASKMRRNTNPIWSQAKAQSGGLYRREHYSLAKLPYHDDAGTNKPQQNGFCIPYIDSAYDYSNAKCGFAFRHGTPWNSAAGLKSFMFGIVFKGRFMYLNSLDYSFAISSGNGTGIWNVHRWNSSSPRSSTDWSDNSTYLADGANYSSFGGSWNAVCALDTLADIDNIHTPSRLIGYGGGYPDGYNGQLTKWSNLSGADAGKDLCSFWINVDLSGTFYF